MTLHLYLSDGGDAADAAIGAVVAQRGSWPRKPVHVWLSGALARPFVFGPVAGLKGWREAQDAAAAVAPLACGLQGPCAVTLEADPSTGPALGTAVDAQLLSGLQRTARARGLRIASIRPAWARATEAHGRGAASELMLCSREQSAVTVLAWRARRWAFAATYAPAPTVVEQAQLVSRLQASLGFDAEQVVQAEIEVENPASLPQVRWSVLHEGASA